MCAVLYDEESYNHNVSTNALDKSNHVFENIVVDLIMEGLDDISAHAQAVIAVRCRLSSDYWSHTWQRIEDRTAIRVCFFWLCFKDNGNNKVWTKVDWRWKEHQDKSSMMKLDKACVKVLCVFLFFFLKGVPVDVHVEFVVLSHILNPAVLYSQL